MKTILTALILMTTSALAGTVKSAGVVMKEDVQFFSQNCDAKRDYVQLNGLPSKAAENLINRTIRRQMTVGKKLKASDCPDETSSEQLSYTNLATFTGEWHEKIGVYYAVRFPGGSGRYAVWCEAYEAKTGEKFDPKSCLKPEAGRWLNARLSEAGAHDGFTTPLQTEHKAEELLYCMTNEGVSVKSLTAGGKIIESEVLVSGEDLKRVFQPSCGLY